MAIKLWCFAIMQINLFFFYLFALNLVTILFCCHVTYSEMEEIHIFFDLYRFLYLYIAPNYIPFSMLGVLSCLCWFCVAAAWHPTLPSWHFFSPFEVEKYFEVFKMEVHLYGSPFFWYIYLHFPIFNDIWREYFQRTIHNESILSFLHGNR